MAQKTEIRLQIFGPAVADFPDNFPNEADIYRVYMYYESRSEEDSSPTKLLRIVAEQLQKHWEKLDKVPQPTKNVIDKIRNVVKKAQKLDNCVYVLGDSKKINLKKAMFGRTVDIELKEKINPAAAKVSRSSLFGLNMCMIILVCEITICQNLT